MWVRIPLETYIFVLNFSLPPRSEQVNGSVANEIKDVHSPEVIVDFRPQIQLIIQGFVYSYLQYSFKIKCTTEIIQFELTSCMLMIILRINNEIHGKEIDTRLLKSST